MSSSWGFAGVVLAAAIALPGVAGGTQDRPDGADGPAVRAAVESGEWTPGQAVQDSAAGRAIFTGKGICQACHGPDAKGTPLAPNLTDTTWLHIDGSMDAIVGLINRGVPTPKNAPAPMPAKGGAQLSDEEIRNVAAYVFSISRPKD